MSLPSLLGLIRKLPPTPFRSGGSPQLSDALEAIVGRAFNVKPGNAASVSARTLSPEDERVVQLAEQSVTRVQDGAARKEVGAWWALLTQFPVSATLLHPAHDPQYYSRMREGVHRSQQGIGRSWWKRFFQVKGGA